MKQFMELSWEERKAMGLAGRAKVEKEFDRQIVVRKYVEELQKVSKCSLQTAKHINIT